MHRFRLCGLWTVLAVTLHFTFVNPLLAKEPTMLHIIQDLLDNSRPLDHPRNRRMPLLLWTVQDGIVDDEALQEEIIRELDRRGIAMIAQWLYNQKGPSLTQSLRIARIQKKLKLPVYVNANACMYSFFNGDERTAHVDSEGKPFFDDSFGGNKMGCPFSVDFRYEPMKEQIDYFVRAYHSEELPLHFVFGDWEIDGPIEFNKAWAASKRCARCREAIPDIENFASFQDRLRRIRADMTRRCYAEPILERYPKALVGNYAVYPHDGYRYWYDYFEYPDPIFPHIKDQGALYRKWHDEFALTSYTFAMPVIYTWYPTFNWYDFDNSDYRWFYNMLLVASNAGAHTDEKIPIIPFVHWHTTAPPKDADPAVQQFSEWGYKELLWHVLLRGADTLFLWTPKDEAAKEIQLLHEVYAASLRYADWLENGRPITFEVPKRPGPVVSGVRVGDRVLVRRTDFDDGDTQPIRITVEGKTVSVPRAAGRIQILDLSP